MTPSQLRRPRCRDRVGVYALTHVRSGAVYIGSSRTLESREAKWFLNLAAVHRECPSGVWRPGCYVSRRMFAAVYGTDLRDWCFVVLEVLPFSASEADLQAAETAHIARALAAAGSRCLNVQPAAYRSSCVSIAGHG